MMSAVSPKSTPGLRSTNARNGIAAKSSARTSLNVHLTARPIAVRTASTLTASDITPPHKLDNHPPTTTNPPATKPTHHQPQYAQHRHLPSVNHHATIRKNYPIQPAGSSLRLLSTLDSGGFSGPLALAQFELRDLARRGLRQLVQEGDGLRRLVAGDGGFHVVDDRFLAHHRTRLEHHEGLGPLAPLLVGHTDDRRFQHCLVGEDRLLDLDRGDVLPTGHHDVLGAVQQLHVAIGVHHAEVAGVEPAAPERGAGRLRIVEIALHHVVAAHHDLAHRHAVRRHVVDLLVYDPKPLSLDHPQTLARQERHPRVDAVTPRDRLWIRRGAGRGDQQRPLQRVGLFRADQRGEHGWRAVEMSDLLLRYELPHEVAA